jgi:hypothetical protein
MHRKLIASIVCYITVFLPRICAEIIDNATRDDGAVLADECDIRNKGYFTAAEETLFSNVFVWSVDRYVGDAEFARISLETWKDNLRTTRWDWDQSDFATNQIMHPYHGYSYFAAGRSNGLGFYESTLLAACGSATWELFGERCAPAMNDLIQTSIGGACFGEMLHRLYVEAAGTGSPLAFLVSPVDAINGALTRRPAKRPRGAIYSLSVSSGLRYTDARRYQNSDERAEDRARTPGLGYEFDCVYGDPYSQDTIAPFEQFELTMSCVGGYRWYDLGILSDGYLLAFSPADSETHRATAGLTLNYDVLWTRNIQFAANALDFTVKSQRTMPSGFSLERECQVGAIMLGVANFYSPESDGTTYLKDAIHDYGYGAEAKAGLSLVNVPSGLALRLNARVYGMKVLSGTVENSEGKVICQRYAAECSFPVGRKLSICLRDTYIRENGWYKNVPNVVQTENEVSVGAALDLK